MHVGLPCQSGASRGRAGRMTRGKCKLKGDMEKAGRLLLFFLGSAIVTLESLDTLPATKAGNGDRVGDVQEVGRTGPAEVVRGVIGHASLNGALDYHVVHSLGREMIVVCDLAGLVHGHEQGAGG